MRNVWKGLVIGGLTGAATGLALDLGERGAQGVAHLGGAVAHRAPDVADQVRHGLGEAVGTATERARAADLAGSARGAAGAAHDVVSDLLSGTPSRAGEVVRPVTGTVAGVLDRSNVG